MDREVYKQKKEIEAWVRIQREKGQGFMKGTVVEADMAPYRNTVIVDVGCGPRPFVEHFPARLAVMLDCCMRGYREEDLLQSETVEKVLCAEGMGEALPFKNDSVDHVFSINMLDHTFAPEQVVEEFRRILRPGGHVHLNVDLGGEPNACEPVVFEQQDIDRLFAAFQLIYDGADDASNPGREGMLIRVYRKTGAEPPPPRPAPDAPPGSDPAKYLEILACPRCRGELELHDGSPFCPACDATYENADGVLILLR